jgi:hypothetical protein
MAARKWASRRTKIPAMLARVATMKRRLPTGFFWRTTPKAPPAATAAKT